MFFPKAMTEVQLIVPSKDLLAVTKILGSHGVFHQIDSTYLGLENLGPSTWQEKAAAYSTVERRIQVLLQTLSLQENFAGKANFENLADLEVLRPQVDSIEASIKATNDELTAEKKKLEQLESQLSQLEPISDINIEVGALHKSNYLYSVPGVIPAANVSRLETSLARVPHVFFTLRDDPLKPLVWLLGPRSNSDVIDRAAKSAYLTPLSWPEEYHGTPAQVAKSIREALEVSKKKIAQLEADLQKLAGQHAAALQKLFWDVHVSRLTADSMARFGQLRHTYVVVGWVPSADLDVLTKKLKAASKELLIEATPISPAEHHMNVPVALQNPGFLGAFELLVNTYARPRYEELDPTVLIGVTFPLLYGAMYGDVGHGLTLALLGLILSRRSALGGLLVACGLSGAIFGTIFGSVFGFEDLIPHLIRPSENVLTILGLAIGAGIVLINLGILLNLYNAVRSKNWGRFFFDSNGLAGWIVYLSFLVFFVFAVGKLILHTVLFPSSALLVAGILMPVGMLLCVVFSHPLQHWMESGHFEIEGGWTIFLIQSAAELLEKFISMLSNTLSYVRVGAFAIVHAGFTGAVFVIARLVGGGHEAGIGFWIVVVLGNLFVIGLEGFIVTIQTMRLHYYEFFSKFFLGGGIPYEPLAFGQSQEAS